MSSQQLNKAPVLLLMFNRPDKVKKSFSKIRDFKPSKLYISCDGPRNKNDQLKTSECWAVLNELIDWDCSVYKKINLENMGCKKAINSGLDWFFNHENEGIIIEDDVVLSPDFFVYASHCLNLYRDNRKIFSITASGVPEKFYSEKSAIYSSHFPQIWGWATWADRWASVRQFEFENKRFNVFSSKLNLTKDQRRYWLDGISAVEMGKLDTWDFHLAHASFASLGLTLYPSKNLVTNIGFDQDSTNTNDLDHIHYSIASRNTANSFTGPYADHVNEKSTKDIDELLKINWEKKSIVIRGFKRIKRLFL